MSKITEDYILSKCVNCSKDVIENELFPLIRNQLVVNCGVSFNGYATPISASRLMTFSEWARKHYKALRKHSYAPIDKQLEMQVDGTWLDHIKEVKAMWPK